MSASIPDIQALHTTMGSEVNPAYPAIFPAVAGSDNSGGAGFPASSNSIFPLVEESINNTLFEPGSTPLSATDLLNDSNAIISKCVNEAEEKAVISFCNFSSFTIDKGASVNFEKGWSCLIPQVPCSIAAKTSSVVKPNALIILLADRNTMTIY